MATSQNKSGTGASESRKRAASSTSGKSSNSSGRSKTGSSSGSGTTKKKKNSMDHGIQGEVIMLLLLCLVIVLFLCMVGVIKGAVGPAVKYFMLGIFGVLAYVLPFLLLGIIFLKNTKFGRSIPGFKIAAAGFAILLIGILLCYLGNMGIDEIKDSPSYMKDMYTFQGGGGAFFGFFACLMDKFVGQIGTIIISIILLIVSLVIITEKSFLKLLRDGGMRLREVMPESDNDLEDEDFPETEAEQLELRNRRRKEIIARREEQRAAKLLAQEEQERKQKEALARKEEQKRRRQEEVQLRRQREDALDDERILNSSRRNNLDFNMTAFEQTYPLSGSSHAKDDMHEITVIPSLDCEQGEDLEVAQNVQHIYSNKYRKHNAMEEIHFADEPETIISQEDEIHFTEESERTVLHTDGNSARENVVTISPEPEENKDIVSVAASSIVRSESVLNGIDTSESVQNGSDIPKSILDVSNMPEPVTERTYKNNASQQPVVEKPKPAHRKYQFPPLKLLKENKKKNKGDSDQILKETALRLQQTLKTFGVAVAVTDISQGPSVTRYELQLGEGIKVNKIVNLADDIKLNLAAQDVRIEAPIPGKAAVGIEIPNKETSDVLIRELLESSEFQNASSKITFAVGKDISGKTIVADIGKMPHMLIAGATGAGKSVCINTLIMSILYKASPDEVKLIMIDPKVVELSVYNGIPHLMIPVVTEPKKASAALQWAVNEMEKRYKLFADLQVRDLKGYNEKVKEYNDSEPEAPKRLPQIIVIVDELADLMMVASKEVEESICRLAQLARAAGIHLIIATQRPSVDVITGLIKANMPSRVAFRVSSGVDSRTILDMVGAEKLLGKGDMLFYPQGYTKPLRVQGAFVSDDEVGNVVEYLKNNAGEDVYDSSVEQQISGIQSGGDGNEHAVSSAGKSNRYDDYFVDACRFVVEKEKASSGMLQRVFKIGFTRAARIVDQMEEAGVVGPEEGTKPRKVLLNAMQLEEFLRNYNEQ
ncbi:MAG: DNA translocase FtsK [Lachnospiraceae bacterium]